MKKSARPTIFVSIASYRDPDCGNTIDSLFARARWPDRLSVGLCWQAIPHLDADRFPVRTRAAQCRVIEVDARESHGVCWARHRIQSLWQGENTVLQIDSHMRFVQDWDEILLAMLAQCAVERPVLSTYPAGFTPPDTIDSHIVTRMHASYFDTDGVLRLDSVGYDPNDAPATPEPNPFCAGGFLFADSRIIAEVPYDPHLYFHGEEVTLSARLFTHGWDVFSPNKVVVYHDYGNHAGRERHWKDHEDWHVLDSRAHKRVRHLLGMEVSSDPDVIVDIERYGLGRVRSLASYEALAKVDFIRRLVDGKTTEQIEAAAPETVRRAKTIATFTDIWRDNGWGAEETRSGPGSTLDATAILRPKLVELFGFLGIDSLVDAGCGELNWIAGITENLRYYFGLDVVDEMLSELRVKFGQRRSHFFAQRDITLDDPPPADAILCRDVLTHLPDYGVWAALSRFKASGARHLIATTHIGGSNPPILLGHWRPLDLCAPPFNLPRPRILILEGQANQSKALGVWHLGNLEFAE